jgi:hypothetical protein
MLQRFLFILFFFIGANALAQGHYSVFGIIKDEKGQPLKSATVFISGSEKITMTDDGGRFALNDLDAGTYQLSVTMLGYLPDNQNIILKDSSANISARLQPRSILLTEVVIGSGSKWEEYYRVFRGQFLGTSENAMDCVILNPKVLNFDYTKKTGVLTAYADKFLIIDNKRLGYRIRYLLKAFTYNALKNLVIYDGDTNFQPLEGSNSNNKNWARNRLAAYRGSLMHYLRSVYAGKVLDEGFITYKLISAVPNQDGTNDLNKVIVDPRPLKYDTITTALDTAFTVFKAPSFFITFDPKKSAHLKGDTTTGSTESIELIETSSLIRLPLEKAIIDRKGSYTDYRAFHLHGNLARKRIADLLPIEYLPNKI